MPIIYIIANEIAIITYFLVFIFRDKIVPEAILREQLGKFFAGLFIFAQIIMILGNLTLFLWPAPTIGNPELLLRAVIILIFAIYHIKKAVISYIESRFFATSPYSRERLYFGFYGISAFVFGIMPLLSSALLRMPATYFYLAIIFLKLILFPELYEKIMRLRMPSWRKVIGAAYIVLMFSSIITLLTLANFFQAQKFNEDIVVIEEPPFLSEIPSNLVRLVDENLARSTMLRYIAEFGSNARLGIPHITLNGSDLIWIAPVYPANLWAENYIKGFIIVHANDPLRPPIIIKQKFYLGNELLGGHDAQLTNYLLDTNLRDSLAYFVVHPDGDIKLILARVKVTPLIYPEPGDIIVYNSDGSVYATYSWNNAPDWIPQLLDEDLLEQIVTNWGSYKRGDSVDLFAGGFLWIPTSPDRVEITEDTRYIIDPDTGNVEAFIHVHPVGNDKTLAGIIKVNRSGIFFHDFKKLGLISGRVAHSIAESNLPRPATGYYFATMGMLYPVKHPITNETVWTWYVPIYWEKEETTVFAGLALINARDISFFAFDTIQEDEHGPDFVNRVLNLYKSVLAGKIIVSGEIELNATVIDKFSYVSNGETRIVLKLGNVNIINGPKYINITYVEAGPGDLTATEWYELLDTDIGDTVHLKVYQEDDKWIISSFDNYNI